MALARYHWLMGRTLRHLTLVCSGILTAALPAAAQVASNASLNGSYWVRYLGIIGYPDDLAVSFAGSMIFDGNGNFTVTGVGYYFNGSSTALTVSASGTYAVQSSGTFAINNPFANNAANCAAPIMPCVNLYGGVGVNGIAVGSSTDSDPQYEDLFVAIPQSPNATASTLNGTYRVAGLEFAGGSLSGMRNPFFNITADGNGNLGNVTLGGTSMALNDAATTQTSAGATYTMTATGSGTLTFPAPSGVAAANQLISGAKNLYVSPDGSFFIAGSPNGYDMQVGVKAISTGAAAKLSGLYFSSTVENDDPTGAFSYQGAVDEIPSSQEELWHWRENFDSYSSNDLTFSDTFAPNDNGTFTGDTYLFAEGGGGNYSIQSGAGGYYFLTVNVKVPTYSGSGVFLDPSGVVNAGSSAPFTAQISPGEVITLYGSGFTSSATPVTASAPLLTTLGGVQVTVNGVLAPISSVSSGQINAWVPYSTPSDGSLLNIQVISNGTPSNVVYEYSGQTSPGVFAVTHANGTLVTTSSPATVGETLVAYACGLGATNPAVVAGTVSPANPLANPVAIYLDDSNGGITQAAIAYQGLAPEEPAGVYQLNFMVPAGMTLNATGVTMSQLDILASSADYSENIQALVPVSH
jgi:uncharacterized protein (TIGR03437 family)